MLPIKTKHFLKELEVESNITDGLRDIREVKDPAEEVKKANP